MDIYTGKEILLRKIANQTPFEGHRYEVYEDLFIGADPNKPRVTGEFIMVRITKHFRVVQTSDLEVQKLD